MKSILNIDKNSELRKIVKEVFDDKEYCFYEVGTQEEADKILKTKDIDIILITEECSTVDIKYFLTEYPSNSLYIVNDPKLLILRNENLMKFKYEIYDIIKRNYQNIQMKENIENIVFNMNICIYESDLDNLKLIKNIFEQRDIKKIKYFNSQKEFIDNNKLYDLYIFDVGSEDEVQICNFNETKLKNPDAIIIILLNEKSSIKENLIYTNEADGFILKPFNPDEFYIRIINICRNNIFKTNIIDRVEYLEKLVITDALTGAYNRNYLFKRLDEEIKKSKRYNQSLSVMMIDIDYFKLVNDTFGHSVGDYILSEIGNALLDVVRDTDIVCRYGGEEFTIILPNTDVTSSKVVAERIRIRVENLEWKVDLKTTISIGLKELSENENLSQLLEAADSNLYKAKKNGRNRIES